MKKLILCDIGKNVTLCSGGDFREVLFDEIFASDNLDNIYRIQFHTPPANYHLERVVELIKKRPKVSLRFYGQYKEDSINWSLLSHVERLQIDLSETDNLDQLRQLTRLKELVLLRQIRSKTSLRVLRELSNLEVLFTSISKDIESISELRNLRFLSLSEVKANNLDFLQGLNHLNDIWLSLGSMASFNGLTSNTSVKNIRIHQVRGFTTQEAETTFSKGRALNALSLENLKHLNKLDFLSGLTGLKYLRLEGLKNIMTYNPIAGNHSMETITTHNSKPMDDSICTLENIKNVWIGDSYKSETITEFREKFKGKNFYYKGIPIKGKWEIKTPFDTPMIKNSL